jgi:hypothetical protein
MSSMPRKQCCETCKEHLFSDKSIDGFKSRLKQNVIYHRSYTLRPTVKINAIPIKNVPINTTNKSLSKTDSSIKPENILNNRTSSQIKPVIESIFKPKAMNSNQVYKSNIRSRSASLPVVSSNLKLNSDKYKAPHMTSTAMNHIRRRVSEIIDSHLLSDIQTPKQSIDSQNLKLKIMENINNDLMDRRQKQRTDRKTIIKNDDKSTIFEDSSDKLVNKRQIYNARENQRETDMRFDRKLKGIENLNKSIKTTKELNIDKEPKIRSDRKTKSSENLNKKLIDRRLIQNIDRESDLKTDRKSSDKKIVNDLILQNYYIGLSRNSLSLIQNCYRDQ